MRDFRLYMLVGGMPQAVSALLETNNLEKVDKVKRTIINLYEKDFNRIDLTGNASKMFHQIPAQLTGNANRYMTWRATNGIAQSSLEEIISEMKESMVINIAHHANDPNAGMALHRSTDSGKHNYEIDFLIADDDKVSSIEVKSSGYKAHASLDAFCEKFSSRIRHKYLVYTKDLRKDTDVLCLQVYMTMFL